MKIYDNVSFKNINITDGFWAKRQKINREITVYSVMNQFKKTGRFDAFRFEWKEDDDNQPHIFWDSDIAKWMESVAYIIAKTPDPMLEKEVDGIIELIEKNQCEDGYFNIFFSVVQPGDRFTDRDAHELYCAGHLMEAAVAYYRATGKRKFLDLMCKYADLIENVFLKEHSAAFLTPGHEEIELALVKLAEATGERRYLELSKHFIDIRGTVQESPVTSWCNSMYNQSHLPVREQDTAQGHSVRACYLYSGMADIAGKYDDSELKAACNKIFDNIVNRKMYITGGIGSSSSGEAFTVDYDLPNSTAYSETCAAIALAFFASRLLKLGISSEYADIVERVMYNGFLSGISLDGKSFFYENPLEILKSEKNRNVSVARHNEHFPQTRRQEVFGCSCCPPNVTRFIASIADYIYNYDDENIYINQYMTSDCRFELNGRTISICQDTKYPQDGNIRICVDNASGLNISFRVPYFSMENYSVVVNGDKVSATVKNGYAYMLIPSDNFCFDIRLDVSPRLYYANPLVNADCGLCCVMAGPVVYCAEAEDNGENLRGIKIPPELKYKYSSDGNLPDCTCIELDGFRVQADNNALYSREIKLVPKTIKLIPYYAFANRGDCDMTVWLHTL